jgi:hypothetical protein
LEELLDCLLGFRRRSFEDGREGKDVLFVGLVKGLRVE